MLSGSNCWFSLPNRRQNFTNCLRQPAKTNPRPSPSRLAVAHFPWWAINCRLADFYCGNITETDWENPQPRCWAHQPNSPGSNFIVAGSYRSPLQTVSDQYGLATVLSYVAPWHTDVHLVAHGTRLPSHSSRPLWLFMLSQVAIVGWQIGVLCSIELQLSAQVDNTVNRSARHVDGAINCRGKRGAGSVGRGIRLNWKRLGLGSEVGYSNAWYDRQDNYIKCSAKWNCMKKLWIMSGEKVVPCLFYGRILDCWWREVGIVKACLWPQGYNIFQQ